MSAKDKLELLQRTNPNSNVEMNSKGGVRFSPKGKGMKVSAKDAIAEATKRGIYDAGTGEVDVGKAMSELKKIGIGGISAKQLSRLRNGHKVRVGSGLGQLVVHPSRYDAMERTFHKGKNMTISLSPEELMANREIGGEGIFGPGFDRFLKKIGIKKQVYAFGDKIKGPVKKAINAFVDKAPAALGAAGAALATAVGQPELAPLAISAGKFIGEKARNYTKKHLTGKKGYLDDPESYQKNPRKKFGDFRGVGLFDSGMSDTPEDYSGIMTSAERAQMMKAKRRGATLMGGRGVCGGDGLYASARGRGMMGMGHPAMMSQPYDALYQQKYQLSGNGLFL